ncbi:hypothetical protein LRS35_25065 [Klebsiella variicola]|uniref:hypothetical protein n=1 Tax=Klebsiella variicola TaxID=244366 RepID=UPI0022AEE262|nr:hypothetical protein [Klebsiella variicola]MCZ3534391.1 hypothetical protein [Klebsiella variicola]
MTKSTITREQLEEWVAQFDEDGGCDATDRQLEALIRQSLAALDSEPVVVPEHITYISEPTIQNILANDDSSPMANAARLLAHEVRFWRSVPLYRHAQPAPVVPDSYVMVPMRLTAENGAKGALSGEFSETKFANCPECFGDDECETCDGSGRIEITVPVTWTTIKEIWAKGVEHFAAAPQEVK